MIQHMPTNLARIIVVDSYAGCRDSIAAVLKELGHEVRGCATGEEALALAAAEPFDLLVAAADLRDIGGVELGRRVRQCYPKLRVLFTTNGGVSRCMLAKPFTLRQLADAVTRVLARAPLRSITAVFAELERQVDADGLRP